MTFSELPEFKRDLKKLLKSTIACKSLKGKGSNSGLRLIYAYDRRESQIVFIELYHKSDKPNEDRTRIKRNF